MASPTPSPESDTVLTLPNNISVRCMRPTDATSLSHYGNSPTVFANLTDRMPQPYTEADATFWINFNADPANHAPSGPYDDSTRTASGPKIPANYCIAIDGEAVGAIGLEFGDINSVFRRSADLGYWLGEKYWGKGVLSVIAPAFVEWMWRTFDILVRLNGCCLAGNVASGKILQKCGLEYEGRRKAFTVKNGVIKGEEFYGMVRPGLVVED